MNPRVSKQVEDKKIKDSNTDLEKVHFVGWYCIATFIYIETMGILCSHWSAAPVKPAGITTSNYSS